MPTVTFNAFSFLQKKLLERGVSCINAKITIEAGAQVKDLFTGLGISRDEVEAVLVNGRTVTEETVLKDNDRVAFVPYGTPGPYRVLLGFVKKGKGRA